MLELVCEYYKDISCSRRALLGWTLISAAILAGCKQEFVHEQKDPDGKVAKLVLPAGEKHPERGTYSLSLPPGFLTRQPLVESIMFSGTALFALGVDTTNYPAVGLYGKIVVPNRLPEEWSVSGPSGGAQRSHTYQVEWNELGVVKLLWDETVINPPKEPIPPFPRT